MENTNNIWTKILKITITLLTALATAFGIQACVYDTPSFFVFGFKHQSHNSFKSKYIGTVNCSSSMSLTNKRKPFFW